MRKHGIVLLLIIALMITSCAPKPSAALDDTSCQAPCWRNISMGMKDTEVISLLNGMKDVEKNTISTGSILKSFWDEEVHWEFTGNHGIYQGICFHNGKVVMMYFEVKGVILSEAIQKYGEPNQVWATKMTLDTTALNIIFMYPEKGICYENLPSWPLFSSSIDTYRIGSSLDVKDIYYFDPSVGMDKYDIGCVWPIDKSLIQPWKGYGDYKVYSAK